MQATHPEDQPKNAEVTQPESDPSDAELDAKIAALDLPAVEPEPQPPEPENIVVEPETPAPRTAAQLRLDQFQEQVRKSREPKIIPPPGKPTLRQAANTSLEMQAGKKRVAAAREQERLRPRPKKAPSEGTMTSVYRPPAHVPGFTNARTKA